MTFKREPSRRPVLGLFFVSGACGLVYEVVWMRHLSLVFGNTVYAASTVMASFMGGLALGSWLFGRMADRTRRPLAVFGVLELLVGLLVLAFPFVLAWVSEVYSRMAPEGWSHAVDSLARVVPIMGILVVPTALMGGTLPMLVKHWHDRFGSLGRKVGWLYGLNSLGAVVGCTASGLYAIGALGVARTTGIAAAASMGVGLAALVLDAQGGRRKLRTGDETVVMREPTMEPCVECAPRWFTGLLLGLLGVAGFTAMAYEVLWLRVFIFLNGGTSYWFTVMLATYIGGLGAGSLVAARWIDRMGRPALFFAALQVTLGVCTLLTLAGFGSLMGVLDGVLRLDAVWRSGNMARFVAMNGFVALFFVLPPGLLMGMSFPAVAKHVAQCRNRIGAGVGTSYFADAFGAILGSLAAGFALIPLLGTLRSLIWMGTLNLATGAVVLGCWGWKEKRARFAPLRLAVLVGLTAMGGGWGFWVIPGDLFATAIYGPRGSDLVYVREDVGGTVTVEQTGAGRTLSINGINVAGTDLAFQTTQKLQAHLAMLLNPDPRDVLQIGFGSGGTAWALGRHPAERVDCVEISSAILKANEQFRDVNRGILEDRRVRVVLDDARSFLGASREVYDAILSDSIHPRHAGNGGLYAVDFFRLCREHLGPRGIFSAWLPMYGLSLDDYRVAVRSLKAVFPHVYVFHTPVGRNEWTIVLGMGEPLRIDYRTLAERMGRPSVKEDLAEIGIQSPEDLLACFLVGDETLGTFLGEGQTLNTDDHPYLEYVAPLSVLLNSRLGLLAPLYAQLLANREAVLPYMDGVTVEEAERIGSAHDSSGHVLEARRIELESRPGDPRAIQHLEAALALNPGNWIARYFLKEAVGEE